MKKLIFLLLILFAGVMANLPDCDVPEWNGTISRYCYMDGLECNNVTDGNTRLDGGSIGATELGQMGLTGLNIIADYHYQSGLDRYMGILALNTTTGLYTGILQHNEEVYGFPELSATLFGDDTDEWYFTDAGTITNDPPGVFWMGNNTLVFLNQSRICYNAAGCAGGGEEIQLDFEMYKFGTGNTFYTRRQYDGNAGCSTFPNTYSDLNLTGYEGYSDVNFGKDHEAGSCGLDLDSGIWFNASTTPNEVEFAADDVAAGSYDTELLWITDQYGCDSYFNVTFKAYEGSSSCPSDYISTNMTCTVNDEGSCIASGTSVSTNVNLTASLYVNEDSGVYLDVDQPGASVCEAYTGYTDSSQAVRYCTKTGGSLFADILYSYDPSIDAYQIIPRSDIVQEGDSNWEKIGLWYDQFKQDISNWFEEAAGGTATETRPVAASERYMQGYLHYYSPVPDVKNLNETATSIASDIDMNGICAVASAPNYDAYIWLGYNNTHFYYQRYNCNLGVTTTDSGFVTTVNVTSINANMAALINEFQSREGTIEPIGIDRAINTIKRYVGVYVDINSVTHRSNEFYIEISNDFVGTTQTIVTPNSCTVSDVSKGLQAYSCTVPSGYYGDVTGVLNLTDDTTVKIQMQQEQDLSLNIRLRKGDMPLPGVSCANDNDVTFTDENGLCALDTQPDTNHTVTFNGALPDPFTEAFAIGDYYNSEGYGYPGEWVYSCANFNGSYWYDFPVDFVTNGKTIQFYAYNDDNKIALKNVLVTVDGDDNLACVTNENGYCSVKIRSSLFSAHSLLTYLSGYANLTKTFTIKDDVVYLPLSATAIEQESIAAQDRTDTSVFGGSTILGGAQGILGTNLVLALILIGGIAYAMSSGFQNVPMAVVGVGIGVFASVMMGFLEMWWGIVLVAFAAYPVFNLFRSQILGTVNIGGE